MLLPLFLKGKQTSSLAGSENKYEGEINSWFGLIDSPKYKNWLKVGLALR